MRVRAMKITFLTCDNPIHSISLDSTRTFDCFIIPFFLSFTCLCLVGVEQEISFVHTALRCALHKSRFFDQFSLHILKVWFSAISAFFTLTHPFTDRTEPSFSTSDTLTMTTRRGSIQMFTLLSISFFFVALHISLFFNSNLQHSFKACIKRA